MSARGAAAHDADILASLRRLEGRATVGDVVAASGLSSDSVRAGLKRLLESHRGHLAVSESGELLYEFDPRLVQRGTDPLMARVGRGLGKALRGAFKAWIVVMLVGYFLVFLVLLVAAIFAGQRGGDSRGSWGRGRRRGGAFPLPNLGFWYLLWGPRWRVGRPYYGRRWERTLDRNDPVPFYKKVFAFVFGPDRPKPTQRQLDRGTIRLIRARRGVLTTADLVGHTALTRAEAEAEMGRLLGAYDGEALVSPDGELVYGFPQIMTSAHAKGRSRAPNPAWLRLERPLELTGNTTATNAVIAGMNAFTLAAGATAPWFIFPRLGLAGPAAFLGLVVVPVAFSVLFFAIPLLRGIRVRMENRGRRRRNVRRVLLGLVYRRSLDGASPVGVQEAMEYVLDRLRGEDSDAKEVERVLYELAAEYDADVTPDGSGALRFGFPAIRRQLLAGESVRGTLELEKREVGDIVYSTSDSPEEADRRDQALFDRALAEGRVDPDRYAPETGRVAYEDDFELVAFDEELRRRGPVTGVGV